MCRPCRRVRSGPSIKSPCVDCGELAYGERCRPCADAARAGASRKPDEIRVRRRALQARRNKRLKDAPGLNARERRELLAAWKSSGRGCTYCPGQCESIDHVIPLALGGTNYEGNLAPACRMCNARKNDSLLIEWRAKDAAA
jgi:5-methylcytosine-specific restriction endonuclease McrA